MRDPRNSLIADLRRSAEAARELRAADIYGESVLRAAMMTAAGQGFEHTTIRGPEGLDLSTTSAATAARAWLSGQGISGKFEHRTGAGGIEAASTFDLVLTWMKPTTAT